MGNLSKPERWGGKKNRPGNLTSLQLVEKCGEKNEKREGADLAWRCGKKEKERSYIRSPGRMKDEDKLIE